MKTATAHNFHVPMSAADVALHEEIAHYAAESAGSSDNLDELLETLEWSISAGLSAVVD